MESCRLYCADKECRVKAHALVDPQTLQLKQWIDKPSQHRHDPQLTYRASLSGQMIKEAEEKIKKKIAEGISFIFKYFE